MEITDAQYRHIEPCLPTPRGNVTLDNLQVLNAILYVAEQGCKWRGLPKRFGNWHTIYTRMNRWSKSGVLDRVFAQLQQTQIIRVKIEAAALDSPQSSSVPAGWHRGVSGETVRRPSRRSRRRMHHQDSSGCRGCSNGPNVCPVSWARPIDAPEGRKLLPPVGKDSAPDPPIDGSGRMKAIRRPNWPG
jgi:transposase